MDVDNAEPATPESTAVDQGEHLGGIEDRKSPQLLERGKDLIAIRHRSEGELGNHPMMGTHLKALEAFDEDVVR